MGDAGSTRRDALRLVLAAPLAVSACRRAPAKAEFLAVPLASLAESTHVRVLAGEEPVELVRRGDEVAARSLWCTHMGCEVRWVAGERRYRCPCHGGVYDEHGKVFAGPPPAPLRGIAVEVRDGHVNVPITRPSGSPSRTR